MTRRRATCGALAVLTLAFVAYGSLVPFTWRHDLTWAQALAEWRVMAGRPVAHVWRGDFPVNVLLFLPAGFFLTGAVAPRARRGAWFAAAVVAASIALVAVALEFAQLFVVSRTASWSDVIALALGGVTGAALWPLAGRSGLDRVWTFFQRATGRQLEAVALAAYAAGWLVVSLLPLLFPRFAYPLARTVWLRAAFQPPAAEVAADWLLAAIAVAPLGLLAVWLVSARSRVVRLSVGAAIAAAVVLLDRLAQVTPLSAEPEAAARCAGVAAGAWLAWRGASTPLAGLRGRPRQAALALAAWSAVLVMAAWAPFDFGVPAAMVEARIEILYQRVPLHRHYWAPPLAALHAVLTVFLLALPLAAMLRAGPWRRGRGLSAASAAAVTTAVFVLLEWGQLYLPARRADVTDVLVAAVGAVTGAWLGGVLAASRRPPPAGS